MSKEELLLEGTETIIKAIVKAKEKQAEDNPEVAEETMAEVLMQLAFASHHFLKLTNDVEDSEHDVFETLNEMARQCRHHMAMKIYEQANDMKADSEEG